MKLQLTDSVAGFPSGAIIETTLSPIDPLLMGKCNVLDLNDFAGLSPYSAGKPTKLTASLSRPADVLDYAAGDHISAAVANVKQKEIVTLTGTSGTANITTTGDLTRLVEFTLDLEITAAKFVTDFAADYLELGIVVTSASNTIIFEAATAGEPFTAPLIANATLTLAGTVAHTTANVTLVPVVLTDAAIADGGGGILKEICIETNIVQLAGVTLRVWLFSETPSLIVGDNVAYVNKISNAGKRLARPYVDVVLGALLSGSDSVIGFASPESVYVTSATNTDLYALVQTLGIAVAPASGGVIRISCNVIKTA